MSDFIPLADFSKIVSIIESARGRAIQAVNTELINMYWEIGAYLSELSASSLFGDKVIDEVAAYMAEQCPETKGFNRRGLYRMKQFFETYRYDEFVSSLLTQITWTNHLHILSKTKTEQERHFYMELAIREKYSSRQLERQLDSAYYERYVLSANKQLPELVTSQLRSHILDSYVLEFLNLPESYSERSFQNAIIENLKSFLLEIGKDFSYVGSEYKLQVGGHDYFIDLLFYHRGLSCLVAFELKIGEFKPEYLGKMNFYLEALDRDCRKENENPSVGIILCAAKDDEVVEYALSRSLSPTLISDYTLRLPDKLLLQNKLHELTELAMEHGYSEEHDD